MPTNPYLYGLVEADQDLLQRVKQFHATHSASMFAILYSREAQRYLYSFPCGRSHLAVRNRALRAHAQAKLPAADACYIIGRCQRKACRCGGGRFYALESFRPFEDIDWYSTETRTFDFKEFPALLASIAKEQAAFERLKQGNSK